MPPDRSDKIHRRRLPLPLRGSSLLTTAEPQLRDTSMQVTPYSLTGVLGILSARFNVVHLPRQTQPAENSKCLPFLLGTRMGTFSPYQCFHDSQPVSSSDLGTTLCRSPGHSCELPDHKIAPPPPTASFPKNCSEYSSPPEY